MGQIFVWTLSDIVYIAAAVLIFGVLGIVSAATWWRSVRCKHEGKVRAILATEGAYRTVIDGEPYHARVAVHFTSGRIEIIETESWEECQKLRDRLATEVNERRASQ